ncbi:UNVERIFIED_ORG: signal peptide peptidase SppA [Rhizobium sophorae]|uniref:S49 family peptidase n=1 Tax=Rhizobium leguminosarum TaxID=384 RepID=UPI001617BFEC|nr:S49 family peptidase [Rhizobium leguminosarum]MBB4520490.1 signal peptide peptidase SppA [Rhizobium leguminosarum]MDH6658371.1 signal peptide peptidase SppA [Rhizobium sophorae]
MAHEIRRVLRAFAAQPWFMDPRKAEQIVAMLELRAASGPRSEPYRKNSAAVREQVRTTKGTAAVFNLFGPIMPRAEALEDVSQQAALLVPFQKAFTESASDPTLAGMVINIDSPGGWMDLVPETAAMIRKARRPDRPIVAVANTLAASAAYWIASAADELIVTPSGEVGSIGVYVVHQDISERLAAEGIRMQFFAEGPRKTEINPFEPMSQEAGTALQARVRYGYDLFVADVAKGRRVSESVVRADPEKSDKHFGGGRVYGAKEAVRLGMADRVATLDETITRLIGGGARQSARAAAERSRFL